MSEGLKALSEAEWVEGARNSRAPGMPSPSLSRCGSVGDSPLARMLVMHTVAVMKVADIKEVAEREPFRPFTVRLNNGAQYNFQSPREIGATRSYNMIFYFGETTAARIDTDSIVEVIETHN